MRTDSTHVSHASGQLKVCIFSADFWGLKSAGGTATAYHLLAAVLGKVQDLEVSLKVDKSAFVHTCFGTISLYGYTLIVANIGRYFSTLCLFKSHFQLILARSIPNFEICLV